MAELSIIIVNYKQKGLVKQCIKGIEQSRISVPYEIIIVDNHSQDGCIEMLKQEFEHVITIASEKNGGFAYGNNLGIKKALGKYIMIMNPDVALTEGAIETMVEFLKIHPRCGIVGPRLIHPDGTIQYSCRCFPKTYTPLLRRTILGKISLAQKELRRYLMMDWGHGISKKVDWIFGACIMLKKEALEIVGIFDERFFLYFEDCDLCRRMWQHGFEVWYVAEVELVHYHQRLSDQRRGIFSIFHKVTRVHIASAIKYFAKYRGVPLPRLKEEQSLSQK